MNLGWHFEKITPMGGAHDGTYRHPLANTGLLNEHKLAREAIQNSVDARTDQGPVKVRFRREQADTGLMNSIGDTLNLWQDEGPLDRRVMGAGLGTGADGFFDAYLGSSTNPQSILYIEDYGTLGLGGPCTSERTGEIESRYYRLLLGFGVADESELSRGGSFGFGKSVYWESSNVSTAAFYSAFDPDESTGGASARLIIAGIYKSHEINGITYSGRAWYGVRHSEDFCAPLTDEDAHRMAERLGFRPRLDRENGTSILILGSELEISEIRVGIENHWWPRIIDGNLRVELSDQGVAISPPDPYASKQLAHYIRAYERAEERVELESEDAVVEKFRRSKDKEVGWCAVVEADRADFPPEDDKPHGEKPLYPDINEVAFIRSPRMVVCYHELPASPTAAGMVGVYVADNDIDYILKLSEPAEHTRWSTDNQRLDQDQRVLVTGIPARVRRTAQRLRDRIAGEEHETSSSPRPLEHLMGRLLDTRRGGPTNVGPKPRDPFQVRTKNRRHWDASGASIEVVTSINLHPSHDTDEAVCAVALGASILRDDTLANDDSIELVSVRVDDEAISPLDPWNPRFRLRLRKGEPTEVSFYTSAFPEYAASRISIETVLVEDGAP